MRIVVDAMGTDNRPTPDVAAGVRACKELGLEIILVGPKSLIEAEVQKYEANARIAIVDAPEQITMNDTPSVVMKNKPLSSMHVGMNLVANGEADAFVSMGNTGAAHAIATLKTLKRIRGVRRPALTALYPIHNQQTIFVDIGANADSKAEWLDQYAIMGDVYARSVLKRPSPRIATLSNGEEEGKGNQLIRDAQARLRTLNLNYVGHMEPKDIMEARADVIVVDGFVGNIFVKTYEASVSYFAQILREEISRSLVAKIASLMLRPTFKTVRRRLDTGDVGGAPLLGVNGVVIIGHGGSDENAIFNAIRQAEIAVQSDVVRKIKDGLAQTDHST